MKSFVQEEESGLVRRILLEHYCATCRLSQVEVTSAMARKQREGLLPLETVHTLMSTIDGQFAALAVVELSPPVVSQARVLLLRHSLRSADAIQLASALELQAALGTRARFLTFDDRLREAALNEGLVVRFETTGSPIAGQG